MINTEIISYKKTSFKCEWHFEMKIGFYRSLYLFKNSPTLNGEGKKRKHNKKWHTSAISKVVPVNRA